MEVESAGEGKRKTSPVGEEQRQGPTVSGDSPAEPSGTGDTSGMGYSWRTTAYLLQVLWLGIGDGQHGGHRRGYAVAFVGRVHEGLLEVGRLGRVLEGGETGRGANTSGYPIRGR